MRCYLLAILEILAVVTAKVSQTSLLHHNSAEQLFQTISTLHNCLSEELYASHCLMTPPLRLQDFVVPDDADLSVVELSSRSSTPGALLLSDTDCSVDREQRSGGHCRQRSWPQGT